MVVVGCERDSADDTRSQGDLARRDAGTVNRSTFIEFVSIGVAFGIVEEKFAHGILASADGQMVSPMYLHALRT